ncbi:MAG: hypothetical protein ACK55I_27635, partial [bacterium]
MPFGVLAELTSPAFARRDRRRTGFRAAADFLDAAFRVFTARRLLFLLTSLELESLAIACRLTSSVDLVRILISSPDKVPG